MLQKTLGNLGIGRRDFGLVFGLLVNAFTWLFFLRLIVEQTINTNYMIEQPNALTLIWSAFYLSIIGFGIIGAVVSKRFSRTKFLRFWIILGVIASLLPVMFNSFTVTNLAVVSAILGASFGIGMPSCLALFAETTKVDNRGRVGGITFLVVSLVAPLLAASFGSLKLTTTTIAIICATWRGIGLGVYYLEPKKEDVSAVTRTSYISIIRDRPFLLYFLAWLMFSIVDVMESSFFKKTVGEDLFNTMSLLEPAIATFFILIAGIMCDWIGRKKIVLSGFVALGAAYAVMGFFHSNVFSWYLYSIVDGAAWGIFYLTFILILWGDLSQQGSREKYYALGSVPFFISYIIEQLMPEDLVPTVNGEPIIFLAFSLAAFFLFLAVLPLIFAPETLPEKKMELRRLKSFAEEAQKTKEKYESKMKN